MLIEKEVLGIQRRRKTSPNEIKGDFMRKVTSMGLKKIGRIGYRDLVDGGSIGRG